MELGEFSLRVLFYHILPSMTTVLFTYAFILGVTKLLRIRSPNWLYWLLALPLLKGLVVLVRGVAMYAQLEKPTTKPILFGIRLWDPFGLLSLPAALDQPAPLSPLVVAVALGAIALLLAGLAWRWGSLLVFYHSLRCGETLRREDAPRLFQMLDTLVPKMGVAYPRVVISDRPYVLPCTVGIRSPAIVISPELVEDSTDDDLGAILAHELAHLVRRDNVVHWILVAVRDVLFFNPFAQHVFSRINLVKEQDCDRLAARATGRPDALGRAILNAALAARDRQLMSLPGNLSTAESFFSRSSGATERVKGLQVYASGKAKANIVAVVLAVALIALGFLLNLYLAAPSLRLPIQLF